MATKGLIHLTLLMGISSMFKQNNVTSLPDIGFAFPFLTLMSFLLISELNDIWHMCLGWVCLASLVRGQKRDKFVIASHVYLWQSHDQSQCKMVFLEFFLWFAHWLHELHCTKVKCPTFQVVFKVRPSRL